MMRRLGTGLLFCLVQALGYCDPVEVDVGGKGGYEASLAATGDRLAVAWYDTRARFAQIYARWVSRELEPLGDELQLTHGAHHAYEPDLQISGGNLIVAWYDKAPRSGELRAWVGLWSETGQPKWALQLSQPFDAGRNPIVRLVGDSIFCAWIETAHGGRPSVLGEWFDLDGKPRGSAFAVAPASRTTWNLNAAVDRLGRAWVVFDAKVDTKRSEMYLAVVDRDTVHPRRLSADDGFASVYPDISLSDSMVALTWYDSRDGNEEVYLYVSSIDELMQQMPLAMTNKHVRRVTYTPGHSIGSYLAWNGTQVGLAWCDDTVGQYEIYFESFTSDGTPNGEAQRITHTPAWSMIPSIVPWRGGFAIAWNEYQRHHPALGRTVSTSSVMLTVVGGGRTSGTVR